MSVFAITTIGFDHPKDNGTMRKRTVGIFKTLAKAQEVLQKNWGGLNEAGWYPWAVVEEVAFGLYPILPFKQQYFYSYKSDKIGWKKLTKCPEPISKYVKKYELVGWYYQIG